MMSNSAKHLLLKFFLPLGISSILLVCVFLVNRQAEERVYHYQRKGVIVAQLNLQAQQLGVAVEQKAFSVLAAQINSTDYLLRQYRDINTEASALSELWAKQKNLLLTLKTAQQQDNAAKAAGKQLDIFQQRLQEQAAELLEKQQAAALLQQWTALLLLVFFVVVLCVAGGYVWLYVFKPLRLLEQQTVALVKNTGVDTAAFPQGSLYSALVNNLQEYSLQMQELAAISKEISKGNLHQQYQLLKEAGELGDSLELVQQKIQTYLQDEQKRSWGSQGIDTFSKLLRDNGQHVEALSKEFISQLVPFVNANQGALFVLEEQAGTEAVLDLKASYAWGRHKYSRKTFAIGEGIIGQVALEKDLVLLTDIPDNFISIGSGLGKANPRCILLLPLIANERFEGVLELASFHSFGEHEISFLKKLAEGLAATISSIKVSNKTQELLKAANAANVHLQSQEEELRQNTEELMATQEAMQKKEIELTGLFSSINFSLFTAELDMDGKVLSANEKFRKLLQKEEHQLIQLNSFQLLQVPGWQEADKKRFVANLRLGEPQNLECLITGKDNFWISASFTPVLNTEGQVIKVMMLASDISEKKIAELAYKAQAEEIIQHEEKLRHYTQELEKLQESLSDKLQEARNEMQRQIQEIAAEKAKNEAILEGCVDGVVSFNEKGAVEFFNKAAEEIWETSRKEMLGKRIDDFLSIEIQQEKEGPQVYFLKNGSRKMLDIRTEVPLTDARGNEIEALLTLTRVRVNNRYLFTAFIQKVTVELF